MPVIEYNPGNLVRLKSGGAQMTVVHAGTDLLDGMEFVRCAWMSNDGHMEEHEFPPEALVKTEPEPNEVFGSDRGTPIATPREGWSGGP